MALKKAPHPSSGLLSAINMTPFIDVMLVLIIIFIVTLPILQHAVSISLPLSGKVELKTTEPIHIQIDGQNRIYWQKKNISLTEYLERSSQTAEQFSDTTLIIEAHPQSSYDIVAQVIASSKRAGLTKINLVTP